MLALTLKERVTAKAYQQFALSSDHYYQNICHYMPGVTQVNTSIEDVRINQVGVYAKTHHVSGALSISHQKILHEETKQSYQHAKLQHFGATRRLIIHA